MPTCEADGFILGDGFIFDGEEGLLMHWSRPAVAALVYLICCAVNNQRRPSSERKQTPAPQPLLDAVSVLHNLGLVAFSAVVFAGSAQSCKSQLGPRPIAPRYKILRFGHPRCDCQMNG